jgi:molecular chaperone DnaJ
MASLNEAWRVLGDPARRARYDAELAGARGRTSASIPVDHDRPAPAVVAASPARYPWRLVMGMGAVGIAVVIIGVIVYRPSDPAPPDNILGPGSCVVIEPNGDAGEVNCTDAHDGVVAQLVPFDAACPDRSEPHRDRQGLGTACVRLGASGATP